jgi:hypothetical protein
VPESDEVVYERMLRLVDQLTVPMAEVLRKLRENG